MDNYTKIIPENRLFLSYKKICKVSQLLFFRDKSRCFFDHAILFQIKM